ncbi:MAG: FkbM family methyltransferase [Planctomycetota bacterium]
MLRRLLSYGRGLGRSSGLAGQPHKRQTVLRLPGLAKRPFYVHGPADRYVSQCVIDTGQMEPLETRLFLELMPFTHGLLDVGSNLGYYAVIAGHVGAEGLPIVAVEPDPRNVELLRHNLALHPRTRHVQVVEAAVSDHVGTADLYLSDDNFGDHRILPTADTSRQALGVSTVTLEMLLRQHIDVDLIKLDTQGAEPLILLPAFDALHARRESLVLVLEFWPEVLGEDTAVALLEMFPRLGFSLFDLNEDRSRISATTVSEVLAYFRACVAGRDTRPFTNLLATARRDVIEMIERTFLNDAGS